MVHPFGDMEELPASGDAIALRVNGRLERKEIERVFDLLERHLDRERVNLYLEIDNYEGFDPDGLGEHLIRVAGLLGKLQRLDRVAVVTDRPLLRGLARIESALLPKVRYEIFRLDEREAALSWVRDERSHPREPTLKILEADRPNVIGFELDGKVSAAELVAFAEYFDSKLKRGPLLRVLGRIRRFEGFDLAALVDRHLFAMKRAALEGVERYAVVGGPSWMAAWVGAVAPLVTMQVRHFQDEERAWEWLGASLTSERPILEEREEEERRQARADGPSELHA